MPADGQSPLFPELAIGGREHHDHYPTPRWVTKALLDYLSSMPWTWWHLVRTVLDPACGEGELLDEVKRSRRQTYGYEIDPARGEEARRRGHQVGVGDSLDRKWAPADACVMNPPYSLAERFLRAALEWRRGLEEANPEGEVPRIYCLLRLSFLEPAKGRRDLLVGGSPDVLILPRRPDFTGEGGDSITSAWFCWPGKGRNLYLP